MTIKHTGHRRVWAGLLGAAAVSGLIALAHSELQINLSKPETETPVSELGVDIRRDATVGAVEKVMPSVVNIATSRLVEYHDFYDELRRQYFGLPPRSAPRTEEHLDSLGSGVIIDEDGYILTNLHVVRRGNRVQVKLADGRVYDADKIVATSKSDVALLKIRAKPGEKFKAIKFAKDDDLLLGETVIALGNPFGLGGSVSRGILSSKNRRPPTGNEPLNVADWLQTDAAINPGNSGGPLVNLHGELVGINVAVFSEGQGIGFAIPARQVSEALSQFFSPEITSSKWFGAWLKGGERPPTISKVQPGSPAAIAGLKPGMQIVDVNGRHTDSLVDFCDRMVSDLDSDEVSLGIRDGGKLRTFRVKMVPFKNLVKQRTGLVLKELTPDDAAQMRLRTSEGLLIESVERGSPADKARLKPGMLVTAFDNIVLNELRDFGFALINKGPDDSATLTLYALQRIGGPYVQAVQAKVELTLRNP